MKTTRSTICLMTAFVFCLGTYAQTCMGFGSVIKQKWQQSYNVSHAIGGIALTLIPVVGQEPQATNAISQASAQFHDFVFNQNRQSWATVGARELPVLKTKTKQNGTLRKAGVGGVRVFTTSGMFWDRVEIEIEKKDGRAQTDIIVCTWDMASGAKNNYAEKTFPNGPGKGKRKFNILNVHGKSISIKLRNRSAVNTFKYSITSQGFLNHEKQRQRGLANQ
ncbi:hypothetical protein [Allomuricauda sp. SCSIO 65647]|uniref:hypothetical protein n=1 Tax=Allomuricauda sp. SCSIO 65647 TaxID=2908843 RepID=UPI001F29065D|nr:hypothetical protein [Muricauda sp. SCSIO 65647]UJH66113.1 hypothetical protein L0P89_09015 [Muricauda sp. SCSIO 65647]